MLSIGGVDGRAETRAVITDGTSKTLNPFEADAKIFMIMKSEYGTEDFKGSTADKYTVTRGDVTKDDLSTVDSKANKVTFDATNQRYWDDAHARSSQLDIWAYAQMGATGDVCTFGSATFNTGSTAYSWQAGAISNTELAWKASTAADNAQSTASVLSQDLLFSNNLVNYNTGGTNPEKDHRLKFNFTSRKFPQEGDAKMIFYHAMSKITINIIEGDGFDKTSDNDFKFATDTNVKLSGFNTSGNFSLAQGEFTTVASSDIPSIALQDTKTSNDPYYLLQALVVPNISGNTDSRFVQGQKDYATNTMMEFVIDNNKYQITSGMLYDALHKLDGSGNLVLVDNATEVSTASGKYIPMEAGKNYIFTFEVGKAKIKGVTATVADWETVTAEKEYPTNARIELILEERDKSGVGTAITDPADVYRAADPSSDISDIHEAYNWNTGYTESNVYENVGGTGWKLRTDWFWPDNKHYYHFRAVMPTKETLSTNTVTTVDGIDCLSLTAGNPYTDVCWGAPIRDKAKNESSDDATYKFNYDFVNGQGFGTTNTVIGGKNQLYQAIGPTEDYLKLILFHMMSVVTITMTSNDGADNYVELGDGSTDAEKTTVKIENYYKTGHVQMGNGLVVTSGTKGNSDLPKIYSGESNNSSTFGVVPQDLTDVQLRITTPDHNEYVVKLTDIKAPAAPSSKNMANPYVEGADGKYTIDRWYPGFKYHYKLVLSKKQVTILSATILEWETIEASYDNVQIQ